MGPCVLVVTLQGAGLLLRLWHIVLPYRKIMAVVINMWWPTITVLCRGLTMFCVYCETNFIHSFFSSQCAQGELL